MSSGYIEAPLESPEYSQVDWDAVFFGCVWFQCSNDGEGDVLVTLLCKYHLFNAIRDQLMVWVGGLGPGGLDSKGSPS